jgi:uncharacterized protein
LISKTRDTAPDVIRGFALLGILIVNIQYMAFAAEGLTSKWVTGFANAPTAFLISTFFSGKFYLLFSLMYGYSSSYIVKGDKKNVKRWLYRCLFFIVFGFTHAILLWHGDILFWYGVFGLLLTFFFFRSDKALKRWNVGIFSLTNLALILIVLALVITQALGTNNVSEVKIEPLDSIMRSGTFIEAIHARFDLWRQSASSAIILHAGTAFSAFLLGIRLARKRYFSSSFDRPKNRRLLRIGLIVGLPIEIGAGLIFVSNLHSVAGSENIKTAATILYFVVAPLLTYVYVQGLLKLIEIRPQLVMWMAPAGRMSLTTYIGQSVIASLIFGPWGLGLFQKLQLWQVEVIAVGIWLVQIQAARLWLARFSQGPLEMLLGKVTNRKVTSSSGL